MTQYNPFFVPDGLAFGDSTVQTTAYSNTAVADFLANLGSNVISTSGNISVGSGSFFVGNGAFLTGITANSIVDNYTNANVALFLANFGSNVISTSGTVTGSTFYGAGNALSNINAANVNGTFGTVDVAGAVVAGYFSGSGNALSGLPASNVSGTFTSVTANGNIQTINGYFLGNIASATGAIVPWSNVTGANSNVQAFLSSGTVTDIVVGSNITAGNISTTGTITAAYLAGSGNAISNVQWSSISGTSEGVVSVLGNLGSNNISNVGTLSFGAGNLTISGNSINSTVAGGTIILDPGITGNPYDGNVSVIGNLIVAGNLTYIDSEVISTGNLVFIAAANADVYGEINGGGFWLGNAAANANLPFASLTYSTIVNAWVPTGGVSTVGNVYAQAFYGDGYNLSNINVANVVGSYGNANVSNFLGAGSNTVIDVTGNITGNVFSGNGSHLTSLNGANVTGQVANALIAGTVTSNAQPNITSVGVLSSLSSSGNITTPGTVGALNVEYSYLNAVGTVETKQTVQTTISNAGNAIISLAIPAAADYTWVIESSMPGDATRIMSKGFLVTDSANSNVVASNYGWTAIGGNTTGIHIPTISLTGNLIEFNFGTPAFGTGNLVLTTTQYAP